jgi:hypothetical protein
MLSGCHLLFPLDPELSPPPTDVAIDVPIEDAVGDGPVPMQCPPRFNVKLNSSAYEIVSGPGTGWTDAEVLCAAGAETIAHLAVPDDRDELDFLKSRVGAGVNAWVGIARMQNSPGTDRASFLEITGGPAAIELWNANEPSNGNNMEYAVAISNGLDFTDFDPTLSHARICECDMQAPIPFDWQ